MRQHIEIAYKVLDKAVRQHSASTIVLSYSGGYDSMVMAHLALNWSKLYAHSANVVVVSVDTLISADGWREFVATSARQIGARRFEIWDNPDLELWKNDVLEHGFAYRKAQHKIYFYYLKQRVFRMVQARYKKHTHDRVMFVNGVRRAESRDRVSTPEIERKGSGVFVNPLVYWTDEDVHSYRVEHGLPINPFYDRFRNSGDCLCNWHNQIKLSDLERHSPQVASVIEPIDAFCRQRFGYGYDDEPSKSVIQELNGQMRLFDWHTDCTPNLCAGCSKPSPRNDALDWLITQRMEW